MNLAPSQGAPGWAWLWCLVLGMWAGGQLGCPSKRRSPSSLPVPAREGCASSEGASHGDSAVKGALCCAPAASQSCASLSPRTRLLVLAHRRFAQSPQHSAPSPSPLLGGQVRCEERPPLEQGVLVCQLGAASQGGPHFWPVCMARVENESGGPGQASRKAGAPGLGGETWLSPSPPGASSPPPVLRGRSGLSLPCYTGS